MKKIFFFLFLSTVLFSCTKDEISSTSGYPTLPAGNFQYSNVDLPDYFPQFNPENDTTFDSEATLGRVLFYDKKISLNKSISCASCHNQSLGFADNEAFSSGFGLQSTKRNSSSLTNLYRMNRFFWDGRESELSDLIFQPIQDHIEMGFTDENLLVERIANQSYYADLFADAYGDTEVNKERIEHSITAFLESMISYQSKYDKGQEMGFTNFTPEELLGKNIFFSKGKCWNCHNGFNLGGSGFANTGLYLDYPDNGRGDGEFKVPSLRNIELTAPYMHDGSIATLTQVLEHYNSGLASHSNLHWIFTEDADENGNPVGFDPTIGWWEEPPNGGNPAPLNLSPDEIKALEAFLNTMTDHSYVSDIKYADPF
ncbi:MAG: cytochrome-c peroxidase [Chitinophagales bacterium]